MSRKRSLPFAVNFVDERCLSCGTTFHQWEQSHLEYCPLCRIALALEELELIL